MKVTAILKGMIDQNGQQPIQIRISHEGKRTFRPTYIKVEPRQFKKGKIVDHPLAEEWNQKLKVIIIQAQAQALTGFEKKAKKISLFEYVKKKIPHLTRAKGTVKQYKTQLNKLAVFQSEIYLHKIDHNFLNRYKQHLKGLGNENNTVWNSFKFLNTFLKQALSEGLIKANPLANYEKPVYKENSRTYLTKPEVKLIDKFARKKVAPELKQAAIWYLIGCYSGLRISDIKAFDKKTHIIGGRLVMTTQKTKEVIGLPVKGKLKQYLEMVSYEPLAMHENTYNKLLKVIAAAVGINKNLHAHVSRHTAAMLLADSGVSQEVTSKILGHKKLATTGIYYKITNKRIDDELKKLK
jgi:site-specific recombinase XerD